MSRSCPVCGHMAENLQSHMGSHSKEEIVSALMRSQQEPAPHPEPGPSNDSLENIEETGNPSTSSEAKPSAQSQSSVGLQGVVGYVDNSALQFLTVNQTTGRQGVNPIILQQASSIQACSLQQTSLVQSTSSSSSNEHEPPRSSVSSQTSSTHVLVTPAPLVTSAGTVQIRRTLNNVNIVNNLGTNFQSTASGQSGAAAGVSSSPVNSGPSSVMIPSVNMGMVGGGILPFNMMGGVASTPLLLPQVNGPTLLVNVPNYMHTMGMGITSVPGMFMPGILGTQIAGLGSVPGPVVVPTAAVTTTNPTQPSVVNTIQTSMSCSQGPPPVVSRPAATSNQEATLHDSSTISESDLPPSDSDAPPGPSQSESSATKQSKTDQEFDMDCDEDEVMTIETKPSVPQEDEPNVLSEVLTISDTNEQSSEYSSISLAALVSPPQMRQRHHSVISHGQTKPRMASGSNQISAIISPRSVSTVQDSLLTSTADQADMSAAPGPGPSTSSVTSSGFHEDNPQLPQLTLNFPSILMMDNQSQSPPSARPSSSVIVSHNSDLPPSQSPASFSFAGQQPITVDTVEALQSALACDNDVQLVVSNELLETPEFKALMHNMDQSNTLVNSMQSTPAVSPRPRDPELNNEDSNCIIRPPAILEESNPPSPVPCSSRDVSREATRQGFDTSADSLLSMTPGSDDDMTLQDLIAVETIDESQMAEDDMHWSSQLSFDSFNYISQVIGNRFVCEKCGLQFSNLSEHRSHISECNTQSSSAARNKKSGTSFNRSKTKTGAGSCTVTSDEAQLEQKGLISSVLKTEPEVWVDESEEYMEESDIKPSHLKQELSVATQNPLGSQSKHWKCGQCKVVYESGPQLLEHLDLIKRAKIKCIPCHLVFDDRKDLIAHRRKDHPAELFKLKFEPEGDIIDEPEPIDEKVYLPNALGEYVCDFCDRAFTDKDMLMKHLSCHIEEKPHECLECGKKFTKANQLREHKKRHFEEGNFQCNFCNKKFFSPNKLREHIRIHTGETPLKCNICGKGFKRHSNLSEHKKIHEPNREVKPAKELFCHCGKVFKTQRDLDWHKEGEHEMVPKKCSYCLEVFVHSSSLTRHIRMKHEGNFMPEGKKTNNYARCPICSQVFYKTSINKHIRLVIILIPYVYIYYLLLRPYLFNYLTSRMRPLIPVCHCHQSQSLG